MTTKTDQPEPTMEEILASIRRIISEENDDAKGEGGADDAQVAADNAFDAPEVSEGDQEDDVLELTEVLNEEPEDEAPVAEDSEETDIEFDVGDAEAQVEEVEEEQPEPDLEPEPDPEAAFEPEPEVSEEPAFSESSLAQDLSARLDEKADEGIDAIDPADENEAIMSEGPSDVARQAFEDLSALLVAGYQGSDNTLEGMVRKMLKPMLKSWLDEHLPSIVERVVAREIARLSRSKKP